MAAPFLSQLLIPSPAMYWLVMSLPWVIAVAGLTGLRRHIPGAALLTLFAAGLSLWMFLSGSLFPADLLPVWKLLTVIAWFGLIAAWIAYTQMGLPDPAWAHGWVISHLLWILIAAMVAVIRAAGAL